MKITKITQLHRGLYAHVCPRCGNILASASEEELMPEFSICDCDRVEERKPVYELYQEDGKTMIRRNTYPRFVGQVTMGVESDIEHIEVLDEIKNVMDLPKALRKAGEFLLKRRFLPL